MLLVPEVVWFFFCFFFLTQMKRIGCLVFVGEISIDDFFDRESRWLQESACFESLAFFSCGFRQLDLFFWFG
jgi:hypothetical protein